MVPYMKYSTGELACGEDFYSVVNCCFSFPFLMSEADLPMDNSDSSNSSGDEERSADSDQEDEQISHLKKELSEVPFCELQELKQKVGFKRYNDAIHGIAHKNEKESDPQKKRKKHRPREMSSKQPVPRMRQVVPVKQRISRDPRFDELSGQFNEDMFQKAYGFLDDVKANERKQVQKELKKTKNVERRHELESLLSRLEQEQKAQKATERRKEADRKRKKAEMELIKKGKKPFYLKKSEKRKLELAEKYQELKESGKLEKYLGKRRKKNTSKERKHMPRRRATNTT